MIIFHYPANCKPWDCIMCHQSLARWILTETLKLTDAKQKSLMSNWLVGGFNPFEKYARQIGSFPQGPGWKQQQIVEVIRVFTSWHTHTNLREKWIEFTLPETNIAPKNGWLEDYFLLGRHIFRGEPLVSGRVTWQNWIETWKPHFATRWFCPPFFLGAASRTFLLLKPGSFSPPGRTAQGMPGILHQPF